MAELSCGAGMGLGWVGWVGWMERWLDGWLDGGLQKGSLTN